MANLDQMTREHRWNRPSYHEVEDTVIPLKGVSPVWVRESVTNIIKEDVKRHDLEIFDRSGREETDCLCNHSLM